MRGAELEDAVRASLASVDANPWLRGNRVSRRHRYVAFMAAKAACSTIKLALHKFETPDVPLEHWWQIHFEHAVPALADYALDDVLQMLSSPDWFRFCVVRNPYDRLASGWKQKLVSDNDGGYEWLRAEIRRAFDLGHDAVIPFRDSVDFLLRSHSMANDPHWVPMTTTMRPDIIEYDAVGRFENFADDFAEILRCIEAPDDVVGMAAVVTNATPPVPLTDLYDDALAQRVYAHYEADFSAFGYTADSWRAR